MKNKIILNVLVITIISIFITLTLNKNTKEYIMYDKALLALTIDGKKATTFPSEEEKYHVDVNCTGGVGKYQPVKKLDSNGIETDEYEMKFTVEDITGDVVCNIDFTSITDADLLINEVERLNSTYNDGYRYQGKEPDNWIWFNNELWRIIGSIPTCTDASISGTSGTCNQSESEKPRLVKIIRTESIGEFMYHSVSSSDYLIWGSGNTLYKLLNEYYYGKKNATGASTCLGNGSSYMLCNYERIGISSDSTDYYKRMIKSVYMNAGTVSDTGTVIDETYDLETSTVSKESKIGLMSASDFAYATSEITYSSIELSSLSGYTNMNWLYGQGKEWTTTPSTSYVMHIDNDGRVLKNISSGFGVRPILYLDFSVYIISGTGTESDPYIIGM